MIKKIGVFLLILGLVGATYFLGRATDQKKSESSGLMFFISIVIMLLGLGIATFPRGSSTK